MNMRKPTSIIRKISIQMTMIVVALLAALILSNVYSLRVVYNNAVANSRQALAYHVNNIQNGLNNSTKDLLEVFDAHIDSLHNYDAMNEEQKYFALIELRRSMAAKLSMNGATDALFSAIPSEGMLLATSNSRIYSREGLNLSDYLKTREFARKEEQSGAEWQSFELNGQAYLIKYLNSSGIIFGAIIKASTLIASMQESANDQNIFYLTDTTGSILASTSPVDFEAAADGKHNPNYLYISESIPEFGEIANVVERSNVFFGLESMQWLIMAIGVTALTALIFIFSSFSRNLFKPILQLVRGAKEVETGNWDYQFPERPESLEFDRLFNSFNSMIREVKSLKIISYEEKLERNKAELKMLQMQLKPHFFLNAISTISSLTYYNKNEEIRQMIGYLSNHLRYMFKGGLTQVSLQEEMQHVHNYIRMQELRYPDRIFYLSDISPELISHPVPQYLIHTFVENTFKHALSYKEMLSIFIKADRVVRHEQPYIRITIEDDGEGFPEEVIRESREWMTAGHDRGEQIGIMNVMRTLKLLYKQDDLLQLSNMEPSGARVVIFIPTTDQTLTPTS